MDWDNEAPLNWLATIWGLLLAVGVVQLALGVHFATAGAGVVDFLFAGAMFTTGTFLCWSFAHLAFVRPKRIKGSLPIA